MEKEQIKSNCIACNDEIGEFELATKGEFKFFACVKCGTVNTYPLPEEKELKEFYSELKFDKSAYDLVEDKYIKRASKVIKKLIKLKSGSNFLNIGMNTNYNEKAAKSLGLNAKSIEEDLDGYTEKADIIFIENCIERSLNPSKIIEKSYDILNDKGILYIKSIDGNHFMIPNKFEKWKYTLPPIYLNYFSIDGIKIIFKKHGFKTIKSEFNLKPLLGITAKKLSKKK